MKSDLIFGLENAGWPALLVDHSATIRRASQAAKSVFGSSMEGEPTLAASIWSAENETTPEQFLFRVERSGLATLPLKLRVKEGATASFQCYVCTLQRDGQNYFVLQLFREMSLPSAESKGPASFGARIAAPTPVSVQRTASEAAGTGPDNPSVELSVAHKQKLDCALQLSRTVALDFNNALTSILGHTSLILSKMEPNHPWRSSLVEVEKSAEKAAETAHDLAAFSRQDKDACGQVAGNLNDLLRRTVELFRTSGAVNFAWRLHLESRLYTVNFDEAKMQQAFVKILDNATQAVGPTGQIIVQTRNQDYGEEHEDGTVRLAPGSYVCVEFIDNGCGIAPEILPRIFEPFFTTKSGLTHRGLGLTWVYGIVTNHGGSVAVSSQLGQGTSVRVYLPAIKKFVKDRTLKNDDLTGSQTILMVDDEDLMLTMGQMVLSSFGYRVLTANSGQKALQIFSQAPSEIDLVITDLVMPQMSGRELMEHLRRISSEVKILCASGFVRPANTEEEETYLQKPFTSQDLLRKVKQVLANSDTT
ncbi:MAG: ATP-binding protein [Verrucomicrobiota bacterium]